MSSRTLLTSTLEISWGELSKLSLHVKVDEIELILDHFILAILSSTILQYSNFDKSNVKNVVFNLFEKNTANAIF